jgi:CRISPR-associated protein Cas2
LSVRMRAMRILVMFDLPTLSSQDIRNYTQFRKLLIQDGYIMMQESVYCKLVLSASSADLAVEKLRRSRPPQGLIQALLVTEKQYAAMECILGSKQMNQVDSTERVLLF